MSLWASFSMIFRGRKKSIVNQRNNGGTVSLRKNSPGNRALDLTLFVLLFFEAVNYVFRLKELI